MLPLGRRQDEQKEIPPHKLEENLLALQQRRLGNQGPSHHEIIYGRKIILVAHNMQFRLVEEIHSQKIFSIS